MRDEDRLSVGAIYCLSRGWSGLVKPVVALLAAAWIGTVSEAWASLVRWMVFGTTPAALAGDVDRFTYWLLVNCHSKISFLNQVYHQCQERSMRSTGRARGDNSMSELQNKNGADRSVRATWFCTGEACPELAEGTPALTSEKSPPKQKKLGWGTLRFRFS